MTQTVYAFHSKKGFLSDIEKYTNDPEKAVTFVSFEVASKRLNGFKDRLKHTCRIVSVQLPFPRTTAVQFYA
jgi:hypothetical protein